MGISNFDGVAFESGLYVGKTHLETKVINSLGQFVGVISSTEALHVSSLTTDLNIHASGAISALGTVTGSNLKGTNTGDVTLGTANGLSITSQTLSLAAASTSTAGVMSLGTQKFAGNKTFAGTIAASNLSGTNTGNVTIGTANGLSLSSQALSMAAASSAATGVVNTTTQKFAGNKTFTGTIAASNLSGTNTGDITVAAGTGITVTPAGSTYTIAATGGNAITKLTGDATATGPGSVALTLATVNSNVSTFGSATAVGRFTVNGKGLITAASTIAIQITESQVTNLTTDLAAKQTTTLTNGNILIGNVSNVAASVAVTGDVTISNAGVTSFGASKTLTTPTLNQPVINGVTNNSSAASGVVGQFISANGTSTSGNTQGTIVNLCSISLTAGDWDVQATAGLSNGSVVSPTRYRAAISLTTTAFDSLVLGAYANLPASALANIADFHVGIRRISVSSTTTVYLCAECSGASGSFSTDTSSFLSARRVR